jgi:spermidine synthase
MQLPLLAGLFRTLRLQDRSLASLLGFDYLGSFVGALAFPLVLFPSLGLFRTVFLTSLINTTTALLSSALLEQRRSRSVWTAAVLAVLVLVAFLASHTLEHAVDYLVYGDR